MEGQLERRLKAIDINGLCKALCLHVVTQLRSTATTYHFEVADKGKL